MAVRSDKRLWFIVDSVAQRLEVPELERFLSTPQLGAHVNKQLYDTIKSFLSSLLHTDSQHHYDRQHHYKCHMRELCDCELLPDNGLNLERLHLKDAKKVFEVFHTKWAELQLGFYERTQNTFDQYMACKKNYGSAQQRYVQTHGEIMMSLKRQVLRRNISIPPHLLALVYWLYMFYCKKEEKNHKDYNKSLHNILSDLFITLLTLKCLVEKPPAPAALALPEIDIPTFKDTLPYISISPEHPVFQQHVLTRMLDIAGINWKHELSPYPSVETLAALFCSKFEGDKQLREDTKVKVLRIVIDQSRYLSLGSPLLGRNYVADKTGRGASQVIDCQNTSEMIEQLERQLANDQGTVSQHSESQFLKWLSEVHRYMKTYASGSRRHFPQLPTGKSEKPKVRYLNLFHHQVLCGLAVMVCGTKAPRIDTKWWFKLSKSDSNPNLRDFVRCVRSIAKQVIASAQRAMGDRQTKGAREEVRKKLAEVVNLLQLIIAVRWYVSEAEKGSEHNQETRKHQEVIFLFMAFRAILLFMLPKNLSPYGVQQVPNKLPAYAKHLRFHLHLPVCE